MNIMRNIVFSILLLSGSAFADDAKKATPAKAPAADKKAEAKKDKITGEVIDITCYVGHEGKGEKHAACATKCLSAGMPAGIVSSGKLYVVVMKDHTAPNAKLAAWAGKEVTATGTIHERDGAKIFEIDTVEPAAAPAPAKK
jgi:hypothetical protein